jgi:hypothetical protein
MKTSEVQKLVHEALDSLPRPYTEHVIDEVMAAIEQNPQWRRRYDAACAELGKTVANNWCGYWIANALGKTGERAVPAKKSTLIGAYSILDADATPPARKPKDLEARQIMSDYYRAHKSELPSAVAKHREAIIAFLMDGMSAEEAFAMVLKRGG